MYLGEKGISKSNEDVRKTILNFIQDTEFEQISDKPRIIIVSSTFRSEVTASILWLRKFGLDIKCIRMMPYAIDLDTIGLEVVTIIPLPESEEYLIKAEKKESLSSTLTVTQQEYIDFYSDLAQKFENTIGVALPPPRPRSYYFIQIGSNVHFEWCFHGRHRSSFGVELHFEKSNKVENIKLLKDIVGKYMDDLEKQTGEALIIQEDWGDHWSRIYFERQEGAITEDLKKWAIQTMLVMHNSILPYLK